MTVARGLQRLQQQQQQRSATTKTDQGTATATDTTNQRKACSGQPPSPSLVSHPPSPTLTPNQEPQKQFTNVLQLQCREELESKKRFPIYRFDTLLYILFSISISIYIYPSTVDINTNTI